MALDAARLPTGRAAPADAGSTPDSPPAERSFACGARILSIGIASTGIFTFAYLATASHVLSPAAYSRISICWAIMFVILSVIYRPIEQLLSRTIADRRARGVARPFAAHAGVAAGDVRADLPRSSRSPCATRSRTRCSTAPRRCTGSSWSASSPMPRSYFARGWLAGNKRFALYGGLVFLESTCRFLFALAVAVGLASGQSAPSGSAWRSRRSSRCR